MLLNTSFDEIYHLFLSQIQDYNLRNLFNNNIDIAQDMLKTFLLRSIPKFANCTKRIMDIDDTIFFSAGKIGFQIETMYDELKKVIRVEEADIVVD